MELVTITETKSVGLPGCSYIYAPAGQAGEYAPLAANPYRGCGHACSYCLTGETLIQMSDGSTKQIADICVGDSIIGIVSNGGRSWGTRITTTVVLAKVESVKAAYRVTLEDGTSAVCSGDHRWLTDRGWKHTTPLTSGQRPFLTTNNSIRKLGTAMLTPPESESYRLGYIAGMIEGDGSIGIYDYSQKRRPSGKTMGVQHRFRLALKDAIGLTRTKRYLDSLDVETTDFEFTKETATRAAMSAIGTCSPARVARITALLIPIEDSEWKRGWLAGIFDAEGSHGKEALMIANNDERILTMTEDALKSFGFEFVRDDTAHPKQGIRILGGRPEHLRFWQLCNPAIIRKFDMDGSAISESVRITSIEPLGVDLPMFDIMTGTENFIANGMISHNCYVPLVLKMKRPEFDAGAVARPNFLDHLRKDALKYYDAKIHEQVMLSFTTDVYSPFDRSLTRPTLMILRDYGLGFCVLTKGGTRALEDIDLYRPDRDAFASTLTSLDDSFSLKWERGAALPSNRLDALKAFHKIGIFTWVSLEPTLDCESSLKIIKQTHEFVDLYKIGRVNYLPMTKTTDWKSYTERIVELCAKLGVAHYVKRDLQCFLPTGYYNPIRVKQNHA